MDAAGARVVTGALTGRVLGVCVGVVGVVDGMDCKYVSVHPALEFRKLTAFLEAGAAGASALGASCFWTGAAAAGGAATGGLVVGAETGAAVLFETGAGGAALGLTVGVGMGLGGFAVGVGAAADDLAAVTVAGVDGLAAGAGEGALVGALVEGDGAVLTAGGEGDLAGDAVAFAASSALAFIAGLGGVGDRDLGAEGGVGFAG